MDCARQNGLIFFGETRSMIQPNGGGGFKTGQELLEAGQPIRVLALEVVLRLLQRKITSDTGGDVRQLLKSLLNPTP